MLTLDICTGCCTSNWNPPSDMPKPSCQRIFISSVLAAENVEVAAMRIALEGFLHPQGQRVHPAAHVGVAGRNPHPHPGGNRDHRRHSSASAATTAVTAAASTAPVIRIRAPAANSISIVPGPATVAREAPG